MATKSIDWESRIGRRLRLRDLHVLSTVAQFHSMAKAAEHLHVTQPAVSKAIGDLEAAVGVRLLDRSPHGVVPTMYGRALLKCELAVFDELKQAIRNIEQLADPTVGEVRIGCQGALGAAVVAPMIEQMSDRYPHVDFHITQLISPNFAFSELRNREIDLMLALVPRPLAGNKLGDDVNVEIVYEDRVVIVAGAQSKWARRRKIELAELVDESWLVAPTGSWTRAFVAETFRARGLPLPRIKAATYSLPMLHSLYATGKFVGALGGLALSENAEIKALPVDAPDWPWPVAIVTLKNRTLSPVIELFMEHVRVFMASLKAKRR
jgi:DNA-binding transcriptional LysR family regulator